MSRSSQSAENSAAVQSQVSSSRPYLKTLLAITGFAFLVNFAVFLVSIWSSMHFSIPNAENWQDFSLAYVPAVNAFKSGFLPYVNFYYPYPPPFLYILTIFSYLPLPSWSSALPLLTAQSLTVVPVYLITREFASERNSVLASILFVLAPTGLYYVDYLWLNPSLTTLFLMVAVYFLVKKHYDLSAVSLALAFGFKQTAVFAIPIIALLVWRRELSGLRGLRYLTLAAAFSALLSLPYIASAPVLYLESIVRFPQNLCGVSPDYCSIAVGTGSPITLNLANEVVSKWNFVASGVNNPVNLALPLFIFFLPATLSSFYPSLSAFLILALLASFVVLLYRIQRIRTFDIEGALIYIILGLLLLFTFYPLYKYYVVGVVPLLALLVRNKRSAISFIVFNFALMLAPRYLSSWILLVALLWILGMKSHKYFKRFFTYGSIASAVFLIVFVPFVATSSVAFPYSPQTSIPVCAAPGTLTVSATASTIESCVLLPQSTLNQSAYVQSPGGAHATFTIESNSSLPFNISLMDDTNGSLLLARAGVTSITYSFDLSYHETYSLAITNDASQNNTITVFGTISLVP